MPTWTFQQSTIDDHASTLALPFGTSVHSGALLIAACAGSTGDTAATPSDTLVNTWNPIRAIRDTGIGAGMRWWYAIANGAGSDTVTFGSAGSFDCYLIAEFTVDAGTFGLGAEVGQNQKPAGTGTDTVTSTAVSTTTADELVLGLSAQIDNNVTLTAGTNFTEQAATWLKGFTGNPVKLESRTQATPASVEGTWTVNVSSNAAINFVATFKVLGPVPIRPDQTRFPKQVPTGLRAPLPS